MIVFVAHFPLRRSDFDEPSMNMQSNLIIFQTAEAGVIISCPKWDTSTRLPFVEESPSVVSVRDDLVPNTKV